MARLFFVGVSGLVSCACGILLFTTSLGPSPGTTWFESKGGVLLQPGAGLC